MVKEIKKEKEFNDFVKKPLVIVDFWATWCMPCQIMGQVINNLSGKFKNIEFAKVNIDENSALAEKFKITNIPTLLFFKKGKLVESKTGVMTEDEFEEKLKEFN